MNAFPTGSTSADAAFSRFPKLPYELRREIWLHCLPDRVEEFDTARGMVFFNDDRLLYRAPPCTLVATTYLNLRPPLITQVCREARDIAFEEGTYKDYEYIEPEEISWASPGDLMLAGKVWRSNSPPKLVHINWEPHSSLQGYYDCYSGDTDALQCLEHTMLMRKSPGSMMRRHATEHPNERFFEIIDRHPHWLIVMYIVVIHAPSEVIAPSGLFGLLGDAPIQIIDVANSDKIEAMYAFCEQWPTITHDPGLRRGIRCSVDEVERYLTTLLFHSRNPEFAAQYRTRIRPAVMFRACHMNCTPSAASPAR
jgi:hypothetical protein